MRVTLIIAVLALASAAGCAARRKIIVPDEPLKAEASALPFVALRTSPDGTCAIRSDATLWCWGFNGRQGLGLGDETRINRPLQVGPLAGVVDVAPGSDHTCALRSDKALLCVGRNAKGQLGDGTEKDSALFVAVPGTWRSVAVGPASTCAVRDDMTLWCWGAGDAGTKRAPSLRPERVGDAADWVSVDSTVTGRKADGTAATFGTLAKAVAGLVCAVRADGTLWCWGDDLIVDSSRAFTAAAPYQMSPDTDWSAVSVGKEHACGLKKNGLVFCWGANAFGQLGIGKPMEDVSFERRPVAVAPE